MMKQQGIWQVSTGPNALPFTSKGHNRSVKFTWSVKLAPRLIVWFVCVRTCAWGIKRSHWFPAQVKLRLHYIESTVIVCRQMWPQTQIKAVRGGTIRGEHHDLIEMIHKQCCKTSLPVWERALCERRLVAFLSKQRWCGLKCPLFFVTFHFLSLSVTFLTYKKETEKKHKNFAFQ